MGLTQTIAEAIKNNSDPVEVLKDYLVEKDSRVTRAEAAGMIRRFNVQVGLLIANIKDARSIPYEAEVEVIEIAWLRIKRHGPAHLADILETELRKRGALTMTAQTNKCASQPTQQF